MLDKKRNIFNPLERAVGRIFSFFPLKPNHYTLLSFFVALFSFYSFYNKEVLLAILFFIVAAFLDFVDGAVARYKNLATKFGAYLDTIVDRFVEGIFLLGILFLPLPVIFLPNYFWIFLILFGSFMTTYAKAAAKEKDLTKEELKGGLLARGERIILIIVALLVGYFYSYNLTVFFLIIIAFLTNFTALQRIFSAFKKSAI